jgi:hypothetical protein
MRSIPAILWRLMAVAKSIIGFSFGEYCILKPVIISIKNRTALAACHILSHKGYKYNLCAIILFF